MGEKVMEKVLKSVERQSMSLLGRFVSEEMDLGHPLKAERDGGRRGRWG